MSLGPMGAFFFHYFSYHHTTSFHHISLVMFFISSLFYLLLILLHMLSTLSGDPSQFITWRIITSFPLFIPQTQIQRSLVWESHLVRESLCYFNTWECFYPLLISSLGSFIYVQGMCIFIYVKKKLEKKWMNEKNEKEKRKINTCVCA